MRATLTALTAIVAVAVTPTAEAAGLTRAGAQTAAKRSAARYIERFGISYPPSLWSASCSKAGAGVYACHVHTQGGQCRGRLTIYRSGGQTRTRRIRIGCAE